MYLDIFNSSYYCSFFQSLLNEAYDNYTAIYLLLLERVKQHRSSPQIERHLWLEQQRRRPSSVAETAMRKMYITVPTGKSSPPTSSSSTTQALCNSYLDSSGGIGAFPHFPHDAIFPPIRSHGRQLPAIPGEQTIHPTAQSYSFPSSVHRVPTPFSCSQDCDVPTCTAISQVSPPFRDLEHDPRENAHLQLTGNISVAPTSILTGKSYRDSESAGSTSIDEGVEVDVCDSECGSVSGVSRGMSDGLQGFKSASQQSEASHFADSPLGSVTSTESTFESFESQLEPDIGTSLTSCAHISLQSGRPIMPGITSSGTRCLLPSVPQQDSQQDQAEREQTRSPIDFREGRRASDGLVTQGLIAFRQRLLETEKALGVTELHSLQQEHQQLTHLYQSVTTTEEASTQQQQHIQYCREWRHSYAGSDEINRPSLMRQRVSLPDPLSLATQKLFLSKDLSREGDHSSTSKNLQQQLFQHRLQQKRQVLQKQAAFSRQSYPVGCDLSRRQMVRQASYKMAQQQPVLPPLPNELGAGHLLADLACPTIEEHEGNADHDDETAAALWQDEALSWRASHTLWGNDGCNINWHTLPSSLAACQISEVQPQPQSLPNPQVLTSQQSLPDPLPTIQTQPALVGSTSLQTQQSLPNPTLAATQQSLSALQVQTSSPPPPLQLLHSPQMLHTQTSLPNPSTLTPPHILQQSQSLPQSQSIQISPPFQHQQSIQDHHSLQHLQLEQPQSFPPLTSLQQSECLQQPPLMLQPITQAQQFPGENRSYAGLQGWHGTTLLSVSYFQDFVVFI